VQNLPYTRLVDKVLRAGAMTFCLGLVFVSKLIGTRCSGGTIGVFDLTIAQISDNFFEYMHFDRFFKKTIHTGLCAFVKTPHN